MTNDELKTKILEDIEKYDGSRGAFGEIITKFLAVGTDPEAQMLILARRFAASKPTIRCWAKGETAPHRVLMPRVFEEIRKTLTAP